MQNFGKIKNAFNEILAEGVVNKNDSNKGLFKKYVKTISENEILKTQFLVYDNIENKVEENEFKANLFLQENLSLLNKFSLDEIKEANLKLSEPILFEGDVDYENKKLHEDIATLIFTPKKYSNVDKIVEATSSVINHITKNKTKTITEAIELPISMMSTIMVDKFNEEYANINETERELILSLIDSDDEKKKDLYSKTIRECIDLIDSKLNESDIETKDKLLRVKDRLLNDKQEINENFLKQISKLIELKADLL